MLTLFPRRLSSLILIVLMLPAPLLADDLWQMLDEAEYRAELEAVTLPEGAQRVTAVRLPASMMDSLEEGAALTLALDAATSHDFLVTGVNQFLNGDTGIRAELVDGAGQHVVSMTRGSQAVLATLYTPSGQYRLQARRAGDAYVGWLFNRSSEAQVLPVDDGAYIGVAQSDASVQIQALSIGEVNVSQTFTPETPLIGDELHINYTITNNTASELTQLPVSVLFLLDDNDFLSATPGCVVEETVFTNGTFTDLNCSPLPACQPAPPPISKCRSRSPRRRFRRGSVPFRSTICASTIFSSPPMTCCWIPTAMASATRTN